MAGDPADVRHTPVNVFGMYVLVILGRAGYIGEIAPGAMLAAFWLSRGAARVHQEERRFSVLRNRLDGFAAIVFENVVNEIVAVREHRRFGTVFAGIAFPNENFVDVLAFFFGGFYRNFGGGFMVHPLAVPPITVSIDQDTAAGIGSAQAASFAAEPAEDDGVHHAQTSAG